MYIDIRIDLDYVVKKSNRLNKSDITYCDAYAVELFPGEFSRQPSIQDTMGDLALGLVGGTIGFFITRNNKSYKS